MNILVVCSCELSILKTGQGRPSSKPEAHNSLKKLHGLWLQCILVHWSYYYQRHVLLLYSSPVVHVTITFFGRITLISENVDEQSLKQTQDTQGSYHVYENALLKVSASHAYYLQSTAGSEGRLDRSSSHFCMNAGLFLFILTVSNNPIAGLQWQSTHSVSDYSCQANFH